MPWEARTLVSVREEFVALASGEGANVSALCARFGISRKTGHKWLGRFRAEGAAGLADRPRRPRASPGRTAPAVEAAVLAARDAHPAWGGRKLAARLEPGLGAATPAPSTITAILRRHGRLPDGAEAPRGPWRRFERPAPNELWQLDFKGPLALADGRCHPLLLLDDHSRFLLALAACADQRLETVQAALTAAFRRYGLPWAILCDNGPPWGAPWPLGALTALGVWLLRLDVALRHGRPFHPQTQGKVERLGGTLEAELLRAGAFPDRAGGQAAFDAWRDEYNLVRPHHALALATPASRYRPSPRPFPEALPPVAYGPDYEVRRVHKGGQISYRGRQHFLSQALGGQPVGLRPTRVEGVLAVHYAHRRVGSLDLRPPEPGFRPGAEEDDAV